MRLSGEKGGRESGLSGACDDSSSFYEEEENVRENEPHRLVAYACSQL